MQNGRMPIRTLAAVTAAVFLAACSGAAGAVLHDPAADEYAVWSAAIQAEFAGVYGTMAVLDTTFSVETITPESEASLRTDPETQALPAGLVDDFIARNHQSGHVNTLRLDAPGVRLIPELGGPVAPLVQQLAPAWLVVSRAGFDRSGDWAMVTVTHEDDGGVSGASTYLIHRAADGRWRKERRIFSAVSTHVADPAR